MIFNDNVYLVSPWPNAAKNLHKIELLPTVDKLVAPTITDDMFTAANASAPSSTSIKITNALPFVTKRPFVKPDDFKKFSLKINVDKSLFNEYLSANTTHLDALIRHLTLKMHLVWAYYHHEHEANLCIEHIELVNFSSLQNVPAKIPLFNIDPDKFLKHTTQPVHIKKLFGEVSSRHSGDSDATLFVHIYEVPQYLLATGENLSGIATRSSISYCQSQTDSHRASVVLSKNNFDTLAKVCPPLIKFFLKQYIFTN